MKPSEMPAPRIGQSQLFKIRQYQRHLAEAHRHWRIARMDVCRFFLKYQVVPVRQLWAFFYQTISFLQAAKLVHDNIKDLRRPGIVYEEGALVVAHNPLLVRRKDGEEDYPVELAVIDPDTLLMTKDSESSLLWMLGDFSHVSDVPTSDAFGKLPEQLWPGHICGSTIRTHDQEVLDLRSPSLYRETLFVAGRLLDRIAIRFPLPPQMRDLGALAVVGFDVAAVRNDFKKSFAEKYKPGTERRRAPVESKSKRESSAIQTPDLTSKSA